MNQDKVASLKQELASLERELSDPKAYKDPKVKDKTRRLNQLKELLDCAERLSRLEDKISQTKKLLTDQDLKQLAEQELRQLELDRERLENRLAELLAPQDNQDLKNVIVEIRAGAGGDEAAIFVGDLYRMYQRWADKHRYETEHISDNPSEAGGFKEVIFKVSGDNVYGQLKHESGVHRVQRVPTTESSGRIHTSTATVAIMLPSA